MSVGGSHDSHEEDILTIVWSALGIFLGLAAFLLLGIGGLVNSNDPAVSLVQGAGAFLLLWAINRALAFLLHVDTRRWRRTPASRASGSPTEPPAPAPPDR